MVGYVGVRANRLKRGYKLNLPFSALRTLRALQPLKWFKNPCLHSKGFLNQIKKELSRVKKLSKTPQISF